MKATYIETWGVHLGWAVPCMGGWLVKFSGARHAGRIEWHWSYTNIRELLEESWAL